MVTVAVLLLLFFCWLFCLVIFFVFVCHCRVRKIVREKVNVVNWWTRINLADNGRWLRLNLSINNSVFFHHLRMDNVDIGQGALILSYSVVPEQILHYCYLPCLLVTVISIARVTRGDWSYQYNPGWGIGWRLRHFYTKILYICSREMKASCSWLIACELNTLCFNGRFPGNLA